MDVARLYRELDPLRPLAADEDALYVDWHQDFGPGDTSVRIRLVRTFVRGASPERPIARLLTGHKGSGKTTELNRVASALRSGASGEKVFVSTLFAQPWLDIQDVQAEDIVLQIVRQLVADLTDVGMNFAARRLRVFFQELWEQLNLRNLPDPDPLRFSFALKDFPTERQEFRELLRRQLPAVYELVNIEILPEARRQLKSQGFKDILLIIDDLDKIPQKVLKGGLTNHENLFLDQSGTLRAISCSILMTVPIELAYSSAQGRLRDDYGGAIATIPLIAVRDRKRDPVAAGERTLMEVIGRRARVAFDDIGADACRAAQTIFSDNADLKRILQLSGGHLRTLLVMLTELLDRVDQLPIPTTTVQNYSSRAAKDMTRGLPPESRELLREVAATKQPVSDPRFFDLLRNYYVFAYESDGEEYWYDINPLLGEVML